MFLGPIVPGMAASVIAQRSAINVQRAALGLPLLPELSTEDFSPKKEPGIGVAAWLIICSLCAAVAVSGGAFFYSISVVVGS